MNQLVIMAKKPVAGGVKSRLAKTIGVARATGVYRSLVRSTICNLAFDARWQTILAIAPDMAVGDPVWPCQLNQMAQGRGDLGVRMQAIFDHTPPGPVIIIGTDIPSISASDIADAFKILKGNDVVFGDAGDGGYWLVGASRSQKPLQLFKNVRWSSKFALGDTIANAKGLTIGFAIEKYDIDDETDYQKWRRLSL